MCMSICRNSTFQYAIDGSDNFNVVVGEKHDLIMQACGIIGINLVRTRSFGPQIMT